MRDWELPNLGRQQRPNLYVGHCTICNRGIYRGQDYGWYRRPLGLSHRACVEGVR